MAYQRTRDRGQILRCLQDDPVLNLYQIGDLDPFFWSHTQWFLGEGDALALLYTGMELPCLLAFERQPTGNMERLLNAIAEELPQTIYAHVSPHLVGALEDRFEIRTTGLHQKMALTADSFVELPTSETVFPLGVQDLVEVQAFYRRAYPDNWFDPRMLETGCYCGIRCDGVLAAVAGVHVYSAEYRVAALGNIATLPRMRRRGLAKQCTSSLCATLFETVEFIGLNVRADNRAAIDCYEGLGFRRSADYCELALRVPRA